MLKILTICTAVSFLSVSGALAEPRITGPCGGDIKKACANVTPGEGRISACMKEHLAEVSDACKARLAQAVAAAKVCRTDVQTQCGSEQRRVGRLACIKDALGKLGDECKAAVAATVARKT